MKTVAAIGVGNRGSEYLGFIKAFHSAKMRISALCDVDAEKLARCGKRLGVKRDKQYQNTEDFFADGLLADSLIIATQDSSHFEIAKKAIEIGYKYILLEKPVSGVLSQVTTLRDLAKKNGATVVVCHVLRYSNYFGKIKRAIRSGAIGDVLCINHTENVGYFHFAHSYVRGNWHREADSTPSILAKCCHDLDLLYWWFDELPQTVSSRGELTYFCQKNAPQGATEYCMGGCAAKADCPYDAESTYITDPFWKANFVKYMPVTVFGKGGLSAKEKRDVLSKGAYGKCVFKNDNDVCDMQTVTIDFGGNKTANLTMTAFSKKCERETHIYGTKGELIAQNGRIKLNIFGKRSKMLHRGLFHLPGHVEGDIRTAKSFVSLVCGEPYNAEDITSIEATVVSHRLASLAEQSRSHCGEWLPYSE